MFKIVGPAWQRLSASTSLTDFFSVMTQFHVGKEKLVQWMKYSYSRWHLIIGPLTKIGCESIFQPWWHNSKRSSLANSLEAFSVELNRRRWNELWCSIQRHQQIPLLNTRSWPETPPKEQFTFIILNSFTFERPSSLTQFRNVTYHWGCLVSRPGQRRRMYKDI